MSAHAFSPVLAFYRVASAFAGMFAGAYLRDRARRGKEDATRLPERFGYGAQPRPAGTLIWLHGASVGESAVALQIVETMGARDPSLSFLVSTGTRTSADLVARRAPPRTIHTYAPIDRADCVRRFLSHWRPDLGVFVESELWPNLILESEAAGVKLALVNARMSPKSIRRWSRWPAAARRLNGAFALVLAADARTADALSRLRDRPTPALGNLKLAADPSRIDVGARATLEAEIGRRPVWLAASTHGGEDEIALAAHAKLRESFADALLMIAPRHPERGGDIAALAGGAPRRSLGQPINGASVYVADTLGELGMLYALTPAALIAGSLLPHLKGHNPAEPAKIGAAIVTGPYVESFQDLFDTLFAADAALEARDAEAIAAAIASLWRDDDARSRRVAAASAVIEAGAHALEATLAELNAVLKRPAHAPA
ncbi:lipid IVA 3-deoxy-D-manno-octulosonic acid transferase [alpha proteobacterium U9-1i]|nr:lipid IVA 3-deoxy-D-manno-octulosonic acid transferase [alpha proteobacterium U9-1i]